MSGGRFEYTQYRLYDVVEELQKEIRESEDDGRELSGETIERFQEGVKLIEKARIYMHRIDWLLSGDDGEETFHKRLEKDLEEFNQKFEQ